MRVIIPCAGRSSRFPNTRPKYLLTMPDGELMLQHAARNWYGKYPITFVLNKQHCEEYGSCRAIQRIYGDTVDVVILDEFTNGPAETIYETIKEWDDTVFYVQDCDSHFDIDFINGNNNAIAYINLDEYPKLSNIANKSFVSLHENLVVNIAEKAVISDKICVGGYKFHSSYGYRHHYELLCTDFPDTELYISHVVKLMINHGCYFSAAIATNYLDCGTYESFIENQKRHKTIFCDLDGVIFYNQSKYFDNNYSIPPTVKHEAVKFLLEKQQRGATLVFTTSRPSEFSEITESALDAAGFTGYRIIYDLPHSPRLLINDVSSSNPWPSAQAINSPRDDDDFWKTIAER